MPLRIKLPANEKVIINGAVIENAGDATTIILHNKVDILRRKEVMSEEDAITPARRVYYALQCAYLFKNERKKYQSSFEEYLKDYVMAAPSAAELSEEILSLIDGEKYYEALRKTLDLISHETERLIEIGMLDEEASAN